MGDETLDPQQGVEGFPMDYHDGSFKYLGQLRLDFYKNAVDRVLKRDPYTALLMAMHGVALMKILTPGTASMPIRRIVPGIPV